MRLAHDGPLDRRRKGAVASGGVLFPFEFPEALAHALTVMKPEDFLPQSECAPTTRREFLQQAAGLAAGAAVLSELPQQARAAITRAAPQLPRTRLGRPGGTCLTTAANPITALSHSNLCPAQTR